MEIFVLIRLVEEYGEAINKLITGITKSPTSDTRPAFNKRGLLIPGEHFYSGSNTVLAFNERGVQIPRE